MENYNTASSEATPSGKAAGGFLILAAVIFAIIGAVHWGIIHNKTASCTEYATGTIVSISHVLKFKGNPQYRWKISYTAEDGAEYTLKSPKTYREAAEGNTVTVFYDPSKPSRAFVEELPPDGGGFEFVSAGVSLLLAVIVLAYKPKKTDKPT